MTRRTPTATLVAALALGLAGGSIALACVSGEFDDGQFRCDPSDGTSACPEGMICAPDGLCRRGALADGGMADAPPDDPAPCTEGACPDGELCNGGVCVPICAQPTWRWEAPADVELGGLVRAPDGHLLVGGRQGASAWIGRFDPCTGFVESTTFDVPGVSKPMLDALAVQEGGLFAVGSANVDPAFWGVAARLDLATLTVTWAQAFDPTGGIDALGHVGSATGGPAWIGGVKDAFGMTAAWIVKATAAGDVCELPAGTWTAVDAVSASGTSIYLGTSEGTHAEMVRYDEPCSTSTDCACDYNWKANDIQLGAAATSLGGMVRVGDTLYAAGSARDDASSVQSSCFMLWMDANASEPTGIQTWDPTNVGDWITGVQSDGDTLFLAGVQGSAAFFDLTSTSVTLTAIALPPTSADYAPAWTRELHLNFASGLAIDPHPGGGVYVAGHLTGGAGTVARCTKQGDCPSW